MDNIYLTYTSLVSMIATILREESSTYVRDTQCVPTCQLIHSQRLPFCVNLTPRTCLVRTNFNKVSSKHEPWDEVAACVYVCIFCKSKNVALHRLDKYWVCFEIQTYRQLSVIMFLFFLSKKLCHMPIIYKCSYI